MSDVQQLLVVKEEVPSEWSPSTDQEEPKLEHIKEEQEELCTSQEAGITRFIVTSVTVKRENQEDHPHSLQLHQIQTEDKEAELPANSSVTQMKTESDGEDSGGAKPARNVHVKEEQKELYTGQEGEQLHVLEEADINRFLPTTVTVKREIEEEEPRSSQCHQSQTEDREVKPPASSSTTQIKTEADGDDCGYNDWQQLLSDSGPEMKDNNGWKETRATELLVNTVKYVKITVTKIKCNIEKSYFCCHCGKDFYHKGNYDSHMRVHTGEKPFTCELCGKGFTQKGGLKTHMRIHTGEKLLACDVCGKGFTKQGILQKHVRVHTGEKPFSCDLCGKKFTVQGALKRHMRVHTREKPFACKLCGKGFTQQCHMKTHMRVHTGVGMGTETRN